MFTASRAPFTEILVDLLPRLEHYIANQVFLGHCQTNLSGPAKSAGLRAFRPPADATRPGRQNGSV